MDRNTSVSFLLLILSAVKSEEYFNTTPQPINSNFTCAGRSTGYYADVPSNCRIYHNCDDQGNKFSYYCPEMTAFRQEALVCDHAHLVDCKAGAKILEALKIPELTSAPIRTDRWTTAKPFQNFLFGRNSTTFQVQKPWPADVAFNVPEPNSPIFRFIISNNNSENLGAKFNRNKPPLSNLPSINLTDWRQSFSQRHEAAFNNIFGKSITSKEIISDQKKANEDQVTVNSWNHPAWGRNRDENGGANFRGRPEINEEIKQSTKSRCTCEDSLTIKPLPTTQKSSFPRSERAHSRSVEISDRPAPTTPMTPLTSEISLRDLTASLEPLVPNALEYDPYYPREPWTTTETYYTPSQEKKVLRAYDAPNFQPPLVGVYFKIPDVLPDLNTLDDIIDRRRLFYIPKTKKL